MSSPQQWYTNAMNAVNPMSPLPPMIHPAMATPVTPTHTDAPPRLDKVLTKNKRLSEDIANLQTRSMRDNLLFFGVAEFARGYSF